ncbi:MAG: radical SAM protein [Scytonema sp. PMC 1069.18]|nr:radical SAM protein [Scytonema sp. PMC 1069.18]MEC4886773.1 radical SAM protein [Scytonema sp. PMC 1070.18]
MKTILYERGIRYLTLVGGEPMLHPKLKEIIAYGVRKGMRPTIVTNGSRLVLTSIRELKESGLKSLMVNG